MSANFDWQTEEDQRRPQGGWDDPIEEPRPTGPRRRPPWRLLAVVGALLAAVATLVWWRVDQRIDATMQAVRTDVIASHNVVQRAAADGDAEVFRSFLSGRDPAWTAGQLHVFEHSLFADRSPFGLTPAAGSLPAVQPPPNEETAADQQPAAITFSPDLNEAVVAVAQPFLTTDGTTVLLEQTAVYRRGDQRWLLAPPVDEFWGDWETAEGENLALIYPRRDAAVALRLADDLDAEIARMCATLNGINCSADLYLTVRLDVDPEALAALARPLGPLRRARENEDILELPAPTLIGLPAGDEAEREAAYAALRDGYARQILAAAIAQATGWRCCDEELLFQMLLEYQFSELSLARWPVGPADYRRAQDQRLRLTDLGSYFHERYPAEVPADRLWEVRTAVDFLIHALPAAPPAEMERIAARTQTLNGFLNTLRSGLLDASAAQTNLDLAFWLYAFEVGARAADETLDAPPPDETLYLACETTAASQRPEPSTLFRYSADEEAWQELYRLDGYVWMSSLPDPRELLLQEFALETERWQTNIWRDGARHAAYSPPRDGYAVSFGETDAAGRQLVTYSYDPGAGITQALAIDLATCDGECATRPLPGLPAWSPSGEWAIYTRSDESFPVNLLVAADGRRVMLDSSEPFTDLPLALGDGGATLGDDLRDVGSGYSPFWLDERAYGFLRHVMDAGSGPLNEQEIVIATLDDPTPHTLLRTSDIAATLPDDGRLRRLQLAYVAVQPQQPARLFVVAVDDLERRAFIFLYDRATGELELRLDLLYALNHSLSFSPDGRYLVVTGQDRDGTQVTDDMGVTLLHDIAANRTMPFLTRLPFFLPSVVYDWTEDGRWLAMVMGDDLVGLVAPADGAVRLVPHGFGVCTSVAWVEE